MVGFFKDIGFVISVTWNHLCKIDEMRLNETCGYCNAVNLNSDIPEAELGKAYPIHTRDLTWETLLTRQEFKNKTGDLNPNPEYFDIKRQFAVDAFENCLKQGCANVKVWTGHTRWGHACDMHVGDANRSSCLSGYPKYSCVSVAVAVAP